MQNIKLIIQYDGTNYKGWQKLNDTDKTIQGKLEYILSRMTGEEIELIGSGRTDAGVHAQNQVANFKANRNIELQYLVEYCNKYLPQDIIVKSAENVQERFHARYNAKKKKYTYRICNSQFPNVFQRLYSYHISEQLDINSMKKAAELFIGVHNFRSFTSLKSKNKSTVREIFSIEFDVNEEYISITFEGNGFLYNMVRILTGTLIEVGLHKLSIDQVSLILQEQNRSLAGFTAPAHGLFLIDVFY